MKKAPLFLLLLWMQLCTAAFAQHPAKYWVQFKDKAGSPYSVTRPAELLSPRALELRQRYHIPVDELDIPVNVRLTLGSSKSLAAFLFAGPQFSFNINDKKTLRDNYHSWSYEDSNLSVNLGGGILITNFLQLSAYYNIDCGKTGELTVDDTYQAVKKHNSKTNAWQLAATIYF